MIRNVFLIYLITCKLAYLLVLLYVCIFFFFFFFAFSIEPIQHKLCIILSMVFFFLKKNFKTKKNKKKHTLINLQPSNIPYIIIILFVYLFKSTYHSHGL